MDEICELFKNFGLHPQTIRQWIKSGLPSMKGRPLLIYGYDLKVFLGKMNASNKCHTEFNQMFCMKCRDGQSPYKKQVQLEYKNNFLKAKAHCKSCKSLMYKSYKLDVFQELKKSFHVVDVLRLYDTKNPTVKTHFAAPDETQPNEPAQKELF